MNDPPKSVPETPSAHAEKVNETVVRGVEVTGGLPIPASTNQPTGVRNRLPDSQSAEGFPSIAGYAVVKKIGEGGMGAVYLAEDIRLHRKAAIKTMKLELATNQIFRDRFEREARAAALLESDYIVPIWGIGEAADGTPYIAMPFLQGEPLDVRLQREPVPNPGIFLRVARDVTEGLAAAHAKGLIHRDIKPGNVWLEGDPSAKDLAQQIRRCKILDFGLARSAHQEDAHLTASGAILGTPAFMAPEQARGERVDHRADLFSLGVMLYRMATGQQPFNGTHAMAVLISLATETPRPVRELNPSVAPSSADLIDRLLCKDPTGRPQSAKEVAAVISQLIKEFKGNLRAPKVFISKPLPSPEGLFSSSPPPTKPGKSQPRKPPLRAEIAEEADDDEESDFEVVNDEEIEVEPVFEIIKDGLRSANTVAEEDSNEVELELIRAKRRRLFWWTLVAPLLGPLVVLAMAVVIAVGALLGGLIGGLSTFGRLIFAVIIFPALGMLVFWLIRKYTDPNRNTKK